MRYLVYNVKKGDMLYTGDVCISPGQTNVAVWMDLYKQGKIDDSQGLGYAQEARADYAIVIRKANVNAFGPVLP